VCVNRTIVSCAGKCPDPFASTMQRSAPTMQEVRRLYPAVPANISRSAASERASPGAPEGLEYNKVCNNGGSGVSRIDLISISTFDILCYVIKIM